MGIADEELHWTVWDMSCVSGNQLRSIGFYWCSLKNSETVSLPFVTVKQKKQINVNYFVRFVCPCHMRSDTPVEKHT